MLPENLKPTIGRIVHFYPPQECKGDSTLEFYASLITQVNHDGSVELATFGPNSLYFQHGVHLSDEPKAGCFCWPVREQ